MNLRNTPKDYNVLFLDMDSYFASVEQQVQPTLRGVPLAVTPYTGGTGCCIAVSSEAKEWGVKTGHLVREAKMKCPKIRIIEARPQLYQFYHREILKILKLSSPFITPLSIDEFSINLTGSDCSYGKSLNMAKDIKKNLSELADYLTCSVGIGSNCFLAKIIAESKKPNGLGVIEVKDLKKFYATLKLRHLPGINGGMERQLALAKVYTPSDFFEKSLFELSHRFKHLGKVWFYRLRGYEVDNLPVRTKTIGHSHVLAPQFRTKKGAIQVLEKLIAKSGYRLRKEGFFAGGVSLNIRFMRGGGFAQAKRCSPFCDTKTFTDNAKNILTGCKRWGTPLYVAVCAFNLITRLPARQGTGNEQISIFKEIERSKEVSRAMDKINDQFGADTVLLASAFEARNTAPDRIPFGRPRYEIRNFEN